jgi:hypothetical protein
LAGCFAGSRAAQALSSPTRALEGGYKNRKQQADVVTISRKDDPGYSAFDVIEGTKGIPFPARHAGRIRNWRHPL